MSDCELNYVPIINSNAGLCLTAANWQETGVRYGSFYLDSLLIKPGIELLRADLNIKSYLAWPQTFILNASTLKTNAQGRIRLISPFDGSKVQGTLAEIIELIAYLAPDKVILPEEIGAKDLSNWVKLPHQTEPFLHAKHYQSGEQSGDFGVYFNVKQPPAMISTWNCPRFALGCEAVDIKQLKQWGINYLELDEPAQLGLAGKVYTPEGVIDLTDSDYEQDMSVIDIKCSCPTCTQQLTRAYLHHLYTNTPLLCYRFLIQHNLRSGPLPCT